MKNFSHNLITENKMYNAPIFREMFVNLRIIADLVMINKKMIKKIFKILSKEQIKR